MPGAAAVVDRPCPPGRLTERADFLRVGAGLRLHSRSFTLQAAAAASEEPRVGLTVTRKVGHAVERNRIKRRLRAALRQDVGVPPADYVIVARREALSGRFAAIVDELRRSFADHAAGRGRKAGPRRKAGASATAGARDPAAARAPHPDRKPA